MGAADDYPRANSPTAPLHGQGNHRETTGLNKRWDTLIKNALVFDGTGAPPVQESLALRDGRIAARGSALDETQATEIIDAQGHWLMPGLLDIHTHLDRSTMRTKPVGLTACSGPLAQARLGDHSRRLSNARHGSFNAAFTIRLLLLCRVIGIDWFVRSLAIKITLHLIARARNNVSKAAIRVCMGFAFALAR